ncbi:hypothetical protein OSTOST_20319 [Ostertagia ostertagi]
MIGRLLMDNEAGYVASELFPMCSVRPNCSSICFTSITKVNTIVEDILPIYNIHDVLVVMSLFSLVSTHLPRRNRGIFDHFACLKCDFRLGGHRYMMKNDHPHCIDCYMKHFARVSLAFCVPAIIPDIYKVSFHYKPWY